MIRRVAFDLDGTLVDSHRDIADATNAVIADLGGTPLEMSVVTGFVGDGAAVLIRRVMKHAGIDVDLRDALDRFLVHYNICTRANSRSASHLISRPISPTCCGRGARWRRGCA